MMCLMSHNQSFIYSFRHLLNVFYVPRIILDTRGEKDKNGTISILRKLMLKICREQSPRKPMGFAEWGLDLSLAFKIFMLWGSENHCKRYEDTQYSVTTPTPKALSQTFHSCPPLTRFQ